VKISLRHLLISLTALVIAVLVVVLITQNPVRLGEQPLLLRALLLNLAVLAALVAVYPFNPLFHQRPTAYGMLVCVPALLPGFFWFLFWLPTQAGDGFDIEQIEHSLITDSSSNAIVEVGFSYPIYTPSFEFDNQGLYTRAVEVFLRMTDAQGEDALFRGVRDTIPGQGLNVESSVRGMLSRNEEYLFNPLYLPPGKPVQGRVVFIISNLDDGASFSLALRQARAVQLELRDPVSGQLLEQIPVARD
jgi:hypothetical protein